MKDQPPGLSQPTVRPLSGFAGMQMLQQQYFYKQLQEFQQQQQLQQFDQGGKQQNSKSQFSSALAKQTAGDQVPTLVNGTPIHDVPHYMWSSERVPQTGDNKMLNGSQMFMGTIPSIARTGSTALQGFPNGLVLPQDQTHTMQYLGSIPQQLGQSIYGNSFGGIRNTSSNLVNSSIQSQDSADILNKTSGNHALKTVMQSSSFIPFHGDQSTPFSGLVSADDGVSVSNQNFHGENMFGHFPHAMQSVNNVMNAGNFLQVTGSEGNFPAQEFHGGREHVWTGNAEGKASHPGHVQGMSSLDPLQQKIIYRGNDYAWNDCHGDQPLSNVAGRPSHMNAGSLPHGNQLDGSDCINMFPSVQSGSWSALMQSAVAEASSSDTGAHDEWNGLSFQKAEVSIGNPSDLDYNGRQSTRWGDPNAETANSLPSRSFHLLDDASMSSYGQSDTQCQEMAPQPTHEQSGKAESAIRRGQSFMCNDASSDSLGKSSKAIRWLEQAPQEGLVVDGGVQKPLALGNASDGAWKNQSYDRLSGVSRPEDASLDTLSMQSSWRQLSSVDDNTRNFGNNFQQSQISESKGAIHLGRLRDGNLSGAGGGIVETDGNCSLSSFPKLSWGFERANVPQMHNDDVSCNNFLPPPGSSISKLDKERSQQLQSKHQFELSLRSNKGSENVEKYHQNEQMGEASVGLCHKASNETNESEREKCYFNASHSDGTTSHHLYHGKQSELIGVPSDGTWSATNHIQLNEKIGGATVSRRFLYHPMGDLAVNAQQAGNMKHDLLHQGSQESTLCEPEILDLGHMSHIKSVENAINSEDVFVDRTLQNSGKPLGSASLRGIPHGYDSAPASSFNEQMPFYPSNERHHSSQNMLELLNKVDQSRELPEAVASDTTVTRRQTIQLSSSEGFALHLAPPSVAPASTKNLLPSQQTSHINADTESTYIDMEASDRGKMWANSQTSTQNLLHSSETSQQYFWNMSGLSVTGQEFSPIASRDISSRLQGNHSVMATSGVHYFWNQLQHQESSGTSGQAVGKESLNLAFARQANLNKQGKPDSDFKQSQGSQDGHAREPLGQALQSDTTKKVSSELNPHAETNFRSSSLLVIDESSTSSQFLSSEKPGQVIRTSEQLPVEDYAQHGVAQQSGHSTMLQGVWPNASTQRSMPGIPSKVSAVQSTAPATTWGFQAVNNHNLIDRGGGDLELGPSSGNANHFPSSQQTSIDRAVIYGSASNLQPLEHGHFTGFHHHHQNDKGDEEGSEHSLVSKPSSISFQRIPESAVGSQPNYSLLRQMQAMNSTENDPNKAVKRLKGEGDADVSQTTGKLGQKPPYGYGASVSDMMINPARPLQHALHQMMGAKSSSFPLEDAKISTCLSSQTSASNTQSQDMVALERSQAQSHPTKGFKHPLPNYQMVTSWFDQFGTNKHGQFVGMSNKFAVPQNSGKTATQQFFFGRVPENARPLSLIEQRSKADANQVGSITFAQITGSLIPAKEHLTPLQPSWPNSTNQSHVTVKSKKRKVASLELLPWNKMVTCSKRRLQSTSVSGIRWAYATNRCVEKIDDEAQFIDDGLLTPGPRRMITFTTQLMQQIVCPLPASVLSAEANMVYEIAIYILAKVSLGDSCCLVSSLATDFQATADKDTSLPPKPGTSRRRFILKLVEGFIEKTKKLENDFLRLEKGSSVLDIRVECQDLERFSIINRFAKFHGREGSASAPGAPSSSSFFDAVGVMPRKLFPQRYVTAVPMPRNLPEGMQCLSL